MNINKASRRDSKKVKKIKKIRWGKEVDWNDIKKRKIRKEIKEHEKLEEELLEE